MFLDVGGATVVSLAIVVSVSVISISPSAFLLGSLFGCLFLGLLVLDLLLGLDLVVLLGNLLPTALLVLDHVLDEHADTSVQRKIHVLFGPLKPGDDGFVVVP